MLFSEVLSFVYSFFWFCCACWCFLFFQEFQWFLVWLPNKVSSQWGLCVVLLVFCLVFVGIVWCFWGLLVICCLIVAMFDELLVIVLGCLFVLMIVTCCFEFSGSCCCCCCCVVCFVFWVCCTDVGELLYLLMMFGYFWRYLLYF